jgi:hypothetical protein
MISPEVIAAVHDLLQTRIEEAQRMAGIPESGLLVEIGRAVGAALGKMAAKL